jgi:hypothetical protein
LRGAAQGITSRQVENSVSLVVPLPNVEVAAQKPKQIMAAEAVLIGPVSVAFFPEGKRTGNFVKIGPRDRFGSHFRKLLQSLTSKFPRRSNRESFLAKQGMVAEEQGSRANEE